MSVFIFTIEFFDSSEDGSLFLDIIFLSAFLFRVIFERPSSSFMFRRIVHEELLIIHLTGFPLFRIKLLSTLVTILSLGELSSLLSPFLANLFIVGVGILLVDFILADALLLLSCFFLRVIIDNCDKRQRLWLIVNVDIRDLR